MVSRVKRGDAQTIISTQREEEGEKEEIQVTTEVEVFENEREAEVDEANAELAPKKAKRAQNSQVLVLRETEVQDANWELDKKQKASEATLRDERKVAEAQEAMAEAQEAMAEAQEAIAEVTSYNRQRISDGKFCANQKEVDAHVAFCRALVDYTHTLSDALGGDCAALLDYLLNKGGIYQEIAKINRRAVKGSTRDRSLDQQI